MNSLLLCFVAMAGCYVTARRSLPAGIGCLLLVGYLYGIVRANQLDGFSHVLFDSALCGLYAATFFSPLSIAERVRLQELRTWLIVLIGWPLLLFLVPRQDILVELVGLRGNVFMLPCLLIGARLTREDLGQLAGWIAALNIGAAAVAATQFVIGIEPFFPRNAVTDIIYRSGDIADFSAYRIPSTFTSAHAYGGAMVLSLPLLLGGWMHAQSRSWMSWIYVGAITVTVLAVFVTGARAPVLQLAVIAVAAVLSGRVHIGQKFRWALVALAVAWIVSGQARLQRFTTLSDPEFIAARISGSVNLNLLELARAYPMGNGLGGGGTSVPYFLQARVRNNVIMENEYARIALELGIPGLLAWILFLAWFFLRSVPANASWHLTRHLVRVATAASFGLGLLGIGVLTSVPATAIMLVAAGWTAVPERVRTARSAGQPQEPAPPAAHPVAWRYGER